jgi:hypothetical protein
MPMTIVWILLAFALLRFAVVAAGAALLIRPVLACPACFATTAAVRRPWLERFARRYEWRWCPHCRWEGLARRVRAAGT